jgi:hypothetical protein
VAGGQDAAQQQNIMPVASVAESVDLPEYGFRQHRRYDSADLGELLSVQLLDRVARRKLLCELPQSPGIRLLNADNFVGSQSI